MANDLLAFVEFQPGHDVLAGCSHDDGKFYGVRIVNMPNAPGFVMVSATDGKGWISYGAVGQCYDGKAHWIPGGIFPTIKGQINKGTKLGLRAQPDLSSMPGFDHAAFTGALWSSTHGEKHWQPHDPLAGKTLEGVAALSEIQVGIGRYRTVVISPGALYDMWAGMGGDGMLTLLVPQDRTDSRLLVQLTNAPFNVGVLRAECTENDCRQTIGEAALEYLKNSMRLTIDGDAAAGLGKKE